MPSTDEDKLPLKPVAVITFAPWFAVVTVIDLVPPVERKLNEDGSTSTIVGSVTLNPLTSSRLRGANCPALW